MAAARPPSDGDGEEPDDALPFAEINVTPFVDVVLVLLVIFMVAAPMMTAGVAVDLPRADAAARLAPPPEPPIELGLTAEGRVFLGREEVARDALPARLSALAAASPSRALHLRADRGMEYGEVLAVMAVAAKAGVARVALVSRPPEGGAGR